MLSLDLEWLAPVSLLRSDRWLNFYMQLTLFADPADMRQLGQQALADLQYYQAQPPRSDDLAAALARCFSPDKPDCHRLEFLQRIGEQLLTWRGNAFEVQDKYLMPWSAFIAKVDPVWILASAYAVLIEHGTLTPGQMAALGSTQCPSAFPRAQRGMIFADNHVHLNGHGASNFSLLDFSAYLSKTPSKKIPWPAQPESPLYASGARDVNELPLLVNGLFHYLAHRLFNLETGASDAKAGSTLPNWRVSKLWLPNRNGTIVKIQQHGANSPAQRLMLAAFDPGTAIDHRWLLLATALLLEDRANTVGNTERCALRAYIHACNLFRAHMIMNGVGLSEFVQYFGFAHRKPSSEVNNYAKYALATDSASHVLREFKVAPGVIKRKTLEQYAVSLIRQGREERCQYVFHFSRSLDSLKDSSRADRDQRRFRFKLRCEIRRLQKELNAIATQRAELPGLTGLTLAPGAAPQTYNLTHLVRGIDVAGNENDLPIEIFAPAIRVLRAARCGNPSALFQPPRQMHLSIHAGEDYSHLISGLRAIDETVRFCDYRAGDRIGHGLALGVDVAVWLERQKRIYLPLQEYVDNLVWCHMMALDIIQQAPQFHAVIHVLEQKIKRWANLLYARPVELDALKKSWELRGNCPRTSQIQSHAYGTEWERWVPDMRYLNEHNKNDEAVTLWRHYLRPPALPGDQPAAGGMMMSLAIGERQSLDCPGPDRSSHHLEVLSKLELELITAIQDLLIERYSQGGIVIEACPTSNVYIGRLDQYHEHPIFRWYPPCADDLKPGGKANRFGLRKGPLRVCVNTDDAGIMPTTIEQEHLLLRDAAVERHAVSGDTAERWIDRIRQIGVEEFTANHLDWKNEK